MTQNQTHDQLRWFVRGWATRIGVKANQIHIREMKNKWASISSSGRITLSEEVAALPERLREYVVVHELVHLLVPNHGAVFKSFMSAYLTDWQSREQELRTLCQVKR